MPCFKSNKTEYTESCSVLPHGNNITQYLQTHRIKWLDPHNWYQISRNKKSILNESHIYITGSIYDKWRAGCGLRYTQCTQTFRHNVLCCICA